MMIVRIEAGIPGGSNDRQPCAGMTMVWLLDGVDGWRFGVLTQSEGLGWV